MTRTTHIAWRQVVTRLVGQYLAGVTRVCSNIAVTDPQDQYLHAARLNIELAGARFEAVVHLGLVGGRTVCVGVDLHAFDLLGMDEDGTMQIRDPEQWVELSARRLRHLRLEELTELARTDMLEWLEKSHSTEGPSEYYDWLRRTQALYEKPAREARPGRPAHLPDELVESVIAGTYNDHVKTGGRTPVVAVRAALQSALDAGDLEETKFVGGASGEVTEHQARALVRRARRLGLLRPAPKPAGEESR